MATILSGEDELNYREIVEPTKYHLIRSGA